MVRYIQQTDHLQSDPNVSTSMTLPVSVCFLPLRREHVLIVILELVFRLCSAVAISRWLYNIFVSP